MASTLHPKSAMILTTLFLALSLAAPGPRREPADTAKAPPKRPPAAEPVVNRGKPFAPRPQPTGEPRLKRRKPPA